MAYTVLFCAVCSAKPDPVAGMSPVTVITSEPRRLWKGFLLDFGPDFTVLAWGKPKIFTELTTEMLCIVVTALFGDFCNTLCRKSQKIPCLNKAETDYVIYAGYLEFLFIKKLKMPGADVEFLCHIGNVPWKLWSGGDSSTQGKKFMVVTSDLQMEKIVTKFFKKDPQQLGNDYR